MDDAAELREDGFRIVTEGNCICIIGGKRGAIYGVYEFLESLCCRFIISLYFKICSFFFLLMLIFQFSREKFVLDNILKFIYHIIIIPEIFMKRDRKNDTFFFTHRSIQCGRQRIDRWSGDAW
jgi:hypothetical protein